MILINNEAFCRNSSPQRTHGPLCALQSSQPVPPAPQTQLGCRSRGAVSEANLLA